MPPRILRDVLIVDRSALARNMYQLLFSPQSRFRVLIADEYQTLFKRSRRLRPDLLVVNSNTMERDADTQFPCPTIVVLSKNRLDLKEPLAARKDVFLIEKPFYPYDLISVANRLLVKVAGKGKNRMVKRGRRRG